MLNHKATEEYWEAQTKKGNNPCHYHNRWQDKYAFRTRVGAFKPEDFQGIERIVDIGAGVGDYTNALSKLTRASFIAFDFPFNIEVAKEKYKNNSQITFIPKSLPDNEVVSEISRADLVLTTTVYVHLSKEAREVFLSALSGMKKGGRVMLLEYAPDEVPNFQKNLSHKEVETPKEIIAKFQAKGFEIKELRPVNYIDSFFFHYLGTNFVSYYLTLGLEWILGLIKYPDSKYKLLIFEKMT